jgi:hypothetical protein
VLGIVPHARQAEFLECRTPIKVAACGRRFGKTVAAGIDLLWFAMTRPGTTQMVIAPTHDQARICWDRARSLAEDSMLADVISHVIESPFPELRLVARGADGSEIESVIMARSASHDGRYTRGHGVDRLVADEASFIPEPVLSQVVPPMLAASTYREQVLLSTPFGMSGYFHEMFRRGLEGDTNVASFQFPSSASPHVSPEFLARQRQLMTEIAFATEYEARFLADQASVFRPEHITAAIDDNILPGVQPGRRYTLGFDPAKYGDRSGCVVLDVTDVPWRAVEVRDIGGREYLHQAEIIRTLATTYNRAHVLVDATAHDQMVEELRRQGVTAHPYKFTNESKGTLVDALVLALEHRSLKIPRHDDLIRELTYYRFETTAAGHIKLGAPVGPGHFDDLVTALALAVAQASVRAGRTRMRIVSSSMPYHSPLRDGGYPERVRPGSRGW